jgi:ATP-binding cassette subfamily B protein
LISIKTNARLARLSRYQPPTTAKLLDETAKLQGDPQMSAVERLDGHDALNALPCDTTMTAIAAVPKLRTGAQRDRSTVRNSGKSAHADRLRPLLALAPYLARYRTKTLGALIALIVASLATLAVPLAVRRMIDFGFNAESLSMINSYFSLMIAVVAVLALASASRVYLVTTLGERIVADLRRDVFSHLTSLSPAFFDSASSGELLSRLAADTTQIKAAVVVSISTALRNFTLFAGASTMMVVSSPRLSGTVIAVIPLIVLPLVGFGRKVRTLSRGAQDTLAAASAYAAELIGAMRTLQAFTNERLATHRFDLEVERAYAAARDSTRARSFLTAVVIFLIFSSIAAVLWVGSHDVLSGQMTAGRLSQFLLYAALAAGALSELSQVWGDVSAASGASERLFEILRLKPVIAAPASPRALPTPPRGDVSFGNVRFAYPTRPDTDVVDGISFAIKAGEKVAIVGPSGAGKSTLFHLLLRFYDPVSGTISFDGVEIRGADPREVRGRIAVVPQEPVIFATNARENIRFGRPGAGDAEVERAAAMAHATEFIDRLPRGFETELGERGVTLSGGQRQRIAIARAILRKAPLLLLDEATSSLDAESETLVQTALEELIRHRTTLVIAHRLAKVLSCDRILVIDQGRIVEQGSHAALVAQDGLYARLARLQLQYT